MVWARRQVSTTTCPKSLISAQSLAFLEEYYAWKLLGQADFRTLSARQVDAFSTLESELRGEGGRDDERAAKGCR